MKVSPHCAPSILITFINMVLMKDSIVDEVCDANMFPGQNFIQKFLVFVAVCCVPVMLLGKPIYIVKYQNKPTYQVSISKQTLEELNFKVNFIFR